MMAMIDISSPHELLATSRCGRCLLAQAVAVQRFDGVLLHQQPVIAALLERA